MEFLHTRTDENPADVTSRGLTAEQFASYKWSNGPAWLLRPRAQWPVDCLQFALPDQCQRDYETEVKVSVCFAGLEPESTNKSCIPFTFSRKLSRTIGITLTIVSFVKKMLAKLKSRKNLDKLYKGMPILKIYKNNVRCAETLNEVELMFVRGHQMDMKKQLEQFIAVQDVIEDNRGILRYRGRLNKQPGEVLPALLCPGHPYTDMMVTAAHLECNHGGTEWTLSTLRRRFWLTGAHRGTANKCIKECVKCRRLTSKPYPYPIAPILPESRTTLITPFQDCGLDYAGPFPIKLPKTDSEKEDGKAWFMLITCLATRAVRLELVASNSTVDFVHALEKFFCRYGVPKTFVLDNAPTFKAGASIINEHLTSQAAFERLEFGKELGEDAYKIKWFHVTPYSPWKGGVYERMVGIVKKSLKRSIGGKVLDFRSLENLLMKVENIVNRRPITKSSDCPKDTLALRPIDFFTGPVHVPFQHTTTSEKDPDYAITTMESAEEAQSLAAAIALRLTIFWKLWTDLYLNHLREKNREAELLRGATRIPKVGEVVICTDEFMPRDVWKTAIILKLIESDDKEIRTVLVRNHKGHEVLKSVNHLVPLEVVAEEDPNPTSKKSKTPAIVKRPTRSTRKMVDYCETGRNHNEST